MKAKILGMLVFVLLANVLMAQGLLEENDYKLIYNLKGKRILVITYTECSYEETVEMSNKWQEWGATVHIAAPTKTIVAVRAKMTSSGLSHDGNQEIKADYLLSEVNPATYDGIYIVGGDNYQQLINEYKKDIKRIVEHAYSKNKIVSAFCHSPAVLSIFDFIGGKKVSVEGRTERKLLLDAGAVVKNQILSIDENIITARFPYSESFIYAVADLMAYPDKKGPFRNRLDAEDKTISFLKNAANTQIFNYKKIARSTLEQIVSNGFKSIIAENYTYNHQQRYLVIDKAEFLENFKETMISENVSFFSNRTNPEASTKRYFSAMLDGVSAIVLIMCKQYHELDEVNQVKQISYGGGSAQNMVLAASALDLGAKILDYKFIYNIEKKIGNEIHIPKHMKIIGAVAIGNSAFTFVPPITRTSKELMIYNKY